MLDPVFRSPPVHEVTRMSVRVFAAQHHDPARACPKCNSVGFTFEEDLSEFAQGGWYRKWRCECNPDSTAEHASMREVGVPDAFLGASLATWTNMGRTKTERDGNDRVVKAIGTIIERIEEATRDGLNIWLHGSKGSGKTWIACAILRAAVLDRGYTGAYFQCTELVRASIHDPSRFSSLYDVGWLVLDGIDKVQRTQTGYDGATLSALLGHRIQHNSPTVFTANCPLAGIHALFGDPVGKDLSNLLPAVTVQFALVGGDYSESKGLRNKWNP